MEINIDHLLNLPLLKVTHIEFGGQKFEIECESQSPAGVCPHCLESCGGITKYYGRMIRDLPVFGKRAYLKLPCRQFHCIPCNRYFSERFDFVEPHQNLTKRLEEYLYKMCGDISVSQASLKEDVHWETVQRIYKKYAYKDFSKCCNLTKVRYLGIDEISIKKGKRDYACVIVDLERAIVIDFLESRHKSFLTKYFDKKGKIFCEQIEVLSSDMWDGFVSLTKEVFPNAVNVIDRFHFFCHLNKALDNERKALRKDHHDEEVFKHLRWPLLKAPNKLNMEERELLEKAFNKAPVLKQIYELRNELKSIFDQPLNELQADIKIAPWQQKSMQLKNKYMDKFLKTLKNWRSKILNYFTFGMTNATVEGINNHIRSIIRRAFGYRNFQNLKTRVLIECYIP